MSETNSDLQPDHKINDRFVVERKIGSGLYEGRDAQSGDAVRVLQLPAEEVASYQTQMSSEHGYLAHVLYAEDGVVVLEHVAGETLAELIERIDHKTPVDAVRFTLRLADAVTNVHRLGHPHGHISAESVIAIPEGGREGPVLSAVPEATIRAPESGRAPAQIEDDAFAVSTLLYHMLIGEPPPRPGPLSVDDLSIVPNEDLRTVLLHGLHADPAERQKDLNRIKGELARWFVDHGNEEDSHPHHMTSTPPPLPPSQAPPKVKAVAAKDNKDAPAVSRATEPPPSGPSWGKVGLVAAGALVVGVGAVLLIGGFGSDPAAKEAAAPKPKVTASAKASSAAPKGVDLGEVAVAGGSDTAKMDDPLAVCVAGYLPGKAFEKKPDLSWLCDEADAQQGAGKLRTEIVKGANGRTSDAMKLFSKMGWYELPAYALVRGVCCIEAKPVTLAKPSEGCESLESAVRDIANAQQHKSSMDEPLKKFDEAARCEAGKGQAKSYSQKGPPAGQEASTFKEFVAQLEE